MKKWIIFCFSLLFRSNGYGQFQAANWPINKYYLKVTQGSFLLDSFSIGGGALGFLANASISDAQGNLLFFSMGIDARDRYGFLMDNGCCLCESTEYPSTCDPGNGGNPFFQGALILPKPGSSNQYYLFIKDMAANIPPPQPTRVTASLIDLSYNGGLGKILERAKPILNDTLSDSRMTACKHANGRDWWLVNHEYFTNRIYTHLITPDSILGPFGQSIGGTSIEPDNSGWSLFSQDGSVFASTTAGFGSITLLDFDRCEGVFSNYRLIPSDSSFVSDVLSFSPNGRFLYAANSYYLYQYDLQSPSIEQSRFQLVHDTANYPLLGMMTLMPDNKIYMAGWTGPGECLSVIDSPDLKAPDCVFHLRSACVTGAGQIHNAPNFPNYNLGALVGSGCDTITGLKNVTIKPKEPRIFPNPADREFYIEMPSPSSGGNYVLELINEAGQIVEKRETRQMDIINVEDMLSGVYFLHVYLHGQELSTTKTVVQH